MRLETIKISDFRNIDFLELKGLKKINVFFGDNAQGKTNIVEALYYLSLVKSFRTSDNTSLVKEEKEFAKIEGSFLHEYGRIDLKAVINHKGQKLFENNKEVKRISDFIGVVNVVAFSPEDVFLFKDSPRVRRQFLNNEISKLSPSYYLAKTNASKLLKERNEILKNDKIDKKLLEAIDIQLSRASSEIARKRADFLKKLEELASVEFKQIFGDECEIRIEYINQFKGDYDATSIQMLLEEDFLDDCRYKVTQRGIHKDDFCLKIDGKKIADYGSQGQNRLAAIALKLATIKIVKEKTGEEAIVILDDVLSELDQDKKKYLFETIRKENQVFMTTTEFEDFGQIEDLLKVEIKAGKAEGES